MKAEIKITLHEELLEELTNGCRINDPDAVAVLLKAVLYASVGKDLDKLGTVDVTVTETEPKVEEKEEESDETVWVGETIEPDLIARAKFDPLQMRTIIQCPHCGREQGFLGRFTKSGKIRCAACGKESSFVCTEDM